MVQVLERLWELQQAMSELGERERSLNEKPEPFATTDREYSEAMTAVEALKSRRTELDTKRREIERTLSSEQETLQKYESQLMQVKNQIQYAAAWKEIDVARKKVKELEDQMLELMSQIEAIDNELAEKETALTPLKEKHDSEYAEWQGSLGGLRELFEKATAKISDIEKEIPDQLKREFRKLFDRRQGVAVAVVENGSCSACRFKVRPAVEQQVRRGEVIKCDSCSRIIYLGGAAS